MNYVRLSAIGGGRKAKPTPKTPPDPLSNQSTASAATHSKEPIKCLAAKVQHMHAN